jgi:hypothetical protein
MSANITTISSAMTILDPIAVHAASYRPTPQAAMNVSQWFATETMEVEVGDTVGRPAQEVKLSRDVVTYLLANGWYITAYMAAAEGGEWTSTATAEVNSSSGSVSNGWSKSESTPSGEKEINHYTMSDGAGGTDNGGNASHTTVKQTPSESEVQSNSSSTVAGSSATITTNGGAPYWYSCFKVQLQRRRIQAENVLQDMVQSFTDAYNEGRQVNSDRYDEIVSLYALMLARTESEANNVWAMLSPDDFKPLAEMVTNAVRAALENYENAVGDLPADWMQSRIDEINDKFNALLAEAQAKMVTAGTYNSTVWPTTASGIERDRQKALNDLNDEMVTLKVEVYGKIATITAEIGQKLLDCEIRIIEAMNKMLVGPTELRNTVLKWMLEFMERRDDDHPSLESLVTVADKLGYAEGAPAANIS